MRSQGVSWTRAAAWAILLVGLLLSVTAASQRHTVVEQREADAFEATAENVQAIVSTQLARQDDLLDSMAGVVSTAPDLTNERFAEWYERARISERFPGGIGVSYIVRVPAADLAEFAAAQVADPVTGLVPSDPFVVFPERADEEYCLTRLGVWEVDMVNGFTIPAGLDYCAPELVPGEMSSVPAVMREATVEAAPSIVPMADLTPGILAEFLPVYATAEVPPTAQEREAQVVGWIAASFDANELVASAVDSSPGLSLAVERRTAAGVERVATSGEPGSESADSVTLPVSDNGDWTVTVARGDAPGGLSGAAQAASVLLGGVVISVLVFVLLRVLGTSRERALAMVKQKTHELEHQALHDSLTGLPNRTLILDRAAQMIARQDRAEVRMSVLFVDLDDFKTVNDTLGHAAGDTYLQVVAERLSGMFRQSDTVGRLGGDEFVVLLESEPGSAGPAVAAQRILDLLSDPIDIDGISVPVSYSIGVAEGAHSTADGFLRDADMAMYAAKDAGKGSYRVHAEPVG